MAPKSSSSRNAVSVAALLGMTALIGMQFGCAKLMFWRAKPQPMHSTGDVTASQGTVTTSTGKNGNTKVELRVKHLAPPSKVASDSTVYVVWFQPKDGEKQNVGALMVNDNLEGRLDTLTPHRRFSISVTPEPSAQVAQPSHEPVFTYEVESKS